MKRLFGAVAIAAVGVAVGASGMQVLHAQSKLPVINVAEINVKDEAAYKDWLPETQKGIVGHSGKYLAGGFNKTTAIAGDAPPNRVVLIQFDSLDAVKDWWKDVGEERTKMAEKFGTTFRIYSVETIEPKK
jgi:uncharacterized protein (DUF1330 family)